MATRKDAYMPSAAALDAVLTQVLRPHVERLMKQGLPALQVTLRVFVQDRCMASRTLAIPDSAREFVDAEVRSEFRTTIDPHRSLFRVQAKLTQPLHESGFSGFHLRGDLRGDAEGWTAKVTGVVGHYNVTTWSPS